jgi:glucosamine kinase
MIDALDPDETCPVALCGGLADALAPFVPERFAGRCRAPFQDSVNGALALALAELANAPDAQAAPIAASGAPGSASGSGPRA